MNKFMHKLFLDIETTGLPGRDHNWETHAADFPNLVSIAWIIADSTGKEVDRETHIIKPENWSIPEESIKIHGITEEKAIKEGIKQQVVLKALLHDASKCELIVGHNVYFDVSIIKASMLCLNFNKEKLCEIFHKDKRYDTMMKSMPIIGLKKWPKLGELYQELFDEEFVGAHTALGDVLAAKRIYYKLINQSIT